MRSGRKARWFGLRVLVSTLLVGLAACQSNTDVSEALDPGTASGQEAGATAGPAQNKMTLGKGSVKVSMLLPLSAAGTTGVNGRKMRDAAQLAMADMGDDLITLTIDDTRGEAAIAKTMTVEAMGSGAKAVIGPTELPAAKQLSRLSGSKRPPVLALAKIFQEVPASIRSGSMRPTVLPPGRRRSPRKAAASSSCWSRKARIRSRSESASPTA